MPEPREELATVLKNWLTPEQLSTLVDEVLQMKKKAHVQFSCKKCGANQFQYGEISDAKAVSGALTELLTQAYGRAGEEIHQQREPIQLVRISSLHDLDVPARPDPKSAPLKPGNHSGRPRKSVKAPKQNPEKVA